MKGQLGDSGTRIWMKWDPDSTQEGVADPGLIRPDPEPDTTFQNVWIRPSTVHIAQFPITCSLILVPS